MFGVWLAYLRIRRQSKRVPGLIKSAFLTQGVRTFFIVSVWHGEHGFPDFGADAPSHVDAVRYAWRASASSEGDRPEIWSIQWKASAAGYNLNWDDVDWYGLLGITMTSQESDD